MFPRCCILREQQRGEKTLNDEEHPNTVTKSLHDPQNTSGELSEKFEEVWEKQSAELPRTVDDSTLKSRSKRESRRQRELEQATFSLKLLKVRSGSLSNSEPSQITDSALPAQIPLSKHLPSSPQASTDSQESFELLHTEEFATSERQVSVPEPMEENQTSPASFKPHFYIADDDGSPLKSAPQTPTRAEKKESVVVIISMQKENPIDQSSREALQRLEMETEEIQLESLSNGASAMDHPDLHSTPEPQTNHGLVTSTTSKPLQLDLRGAAVATSEPMKDVQKKLVSQSISISMKEKANLAFSPKRSRLTFSK